MSIILATNCREGNFLEPNLYTAPLQWPFLKDELKLALATIDAVCNGKRFFLLSKQERNKNLNKTGHRLFIFGINSGCFSPLK